VLQATATNAGTRVAEFALRTAGPARRIEFVRDASAVFDDSRRTTQIEFRIVDDAGVRVPDADTEVTFQIEGPARLLGIGNGNLNDIQPGKESSHRAYQGRGLLILRLVDPAASVTVGASAPGLEGARLIVRD
jgi:beta-galactosidase